MVHLQVDGFAVKVILRFEGYELHINNVLMDEWKGVGFSLPFVGGTRLKAKPQSGTYIEAHIRNMAVGFRLEVRRNGELVHSELFF